MAEHKVSGAEILLLIDPTGGTTYQNIVCLNTHSFKTETNVIDATTKCGADSLVGIPPPDTIDFEGLQSYDEGTSATSGAELYNLKKNGTVFGWKIGRATLVTGDVVKTGLGFISSLSEEYSKDSSASFSGTITVKGVPVQTITV